MTRSPAVSVVIPAYNAEQFLEETVRSVVAQDLRPLEIIVVNDGSKDGTLQLAEALAAELSDGELTARVIDVVPNAGAANALATGFSSARGEFVCWLSADDAYVEPWKLSRQLRMMRRGRAGLSYYRDFVAGPTVGLATPVLPSFIPRLRALDRLILLDPLAVLGLLFFGNPINGSSVMVRRDDYERAGGFDPAVRNIDPDGDLWMRMLASGSRFQMIAGAPIFYREHEGQTSQATDEMRIGCELTRLRIVAALDRSGGLPRLARHLAPLLWPIHHFRLHSLVPLTVTTAARLLQGKGVGGRGLEGLAEELGKPDPGPDADRRLAELCASPVYERFEDQLIRR